MSLKFGPDSWLVWHQHTHTCNTHSQSTNSTHTQAPGRMTFQGVVGSICRSVPRPQQQSQRTQSHTATLPTVTPFKQNLQSTQPAIFSECEHCLLFSTLVMPLFKQQGRVPCKGWWHEVSIDDLPICQLLCSTRVQAWGRGPGSEKQGHKSPRYKLRTP